MHERKLRLIDNEAVYNLSRDPETVAERARRLQQEAQVLACEEVEMLRHALSEVVAKAEAIRDGGDIFPVGVREQARQLAATLPQTNQTLQALSERHLRRVTGEPTPPIWRSDV